MHETQERGSTVINLTDVPGGSFTRQLASGESQDVRVSPLKVGTHPVTVAEYNAFLRDVGWEPRSTPKVWDGEWRSGPTFAEINGHGDAKPIVGVSFFDALEFVDWLGTRYGRPYRLPTEAEFHYFSLGGRPEAGGCEHAAKALRERELRVLPGRVPEVCPWNVGMDEPNEYGLHDTHGLVWQWCSDWYANYSPDVSADPAGPAHQPDHTIWEGLPHPHGRSIRGGSFSYPTSYAECDRRHYTYPTDRTFTLGFRVVADGQ